MDDRTGQGKQLTSAFPTLYAAGVVAMTVFVACTLLFPQPIKLYRVRGIVQQQAPAIDVPLDLPMLRKGEIERIARQVFSEALLPDDRLPRGFHDSISFATESPTPHEVLVTIETRDRYADRALALARQIAAALVEQQPVSLVPGLEALQSQRSDVQQRLSLVHASRESLENDLTELEQDHLSGLSAAVQRVIAVSENSQEPAPKSEYARMETELQELLSTRMQLTRTRTDNHPQVKEIDERLADLKARFEQVSTALQAAVRKTSATAAQRTTAGQLASLNDTFRRRSMETIQAIAEARRREATLEAEAAKLAVNPAAVTLQTAVILQPQVVERIGGRPSVWRLSAFALLALSAGGGVHYLLHYATARRHLRTTDDIRNQLGMPVVSLVGQQSIDSSVHLERALRRSVLVTEILLLVLALTAFSLVSSQPQLARPVALDPLGAVAESLDRTLSATLRR